MKKYRKIWAVLLTLAMVLGMSMTTMAATTTKTLNGTPSDSDKGVVTIGGLEAGATVKAYQIIKATYDNNAGFTGYEWVNGTGKTGAIEVTTDTEGTDTVTGLNSTFITGLAADTSKLGTPETATVATDATSVNMDLAAGTWMFIVTPSSTNAGKTYNPMIASVYYVARNNAGGKVDIGSDNVDATTKWGLESTNAFAKSTGIEIYKTVANDTQEVGKDAEFTVTTTIPSYSAAYTDAVLKFKVEDTIKNGLQYNKSAGVNVWVGGTDDDKKVVASDNTYELTYDDTRNSFTVKFKPSYLRSFAGKDAEARAVTITYKATVTADAIVTPAENQVTLTYSTSPSGETATKNDTEKVFTFELNGVLQKVKEDGSPLGGATFTLYRDSECNNVFATSEETDDTHGKIVFQGIDGETDGSVKYYLKETKAPDGYSLNDTIYEVWVSSITKAADKDDTITSYVVSVQVLGNTDASKTKTITVEYGKAVAADAKADTIVNTKLSTLPSTGGIGTTIFTIGGCAIMIAAAFLFFASRKKNDNK